MKNASSRPHPILCSLIFLLFIAILSGCSGGGGGEGGSNGGGAAATPTPTPTPASSPIAMEFVTIPAGSFTMGSGDEGFYDENPQHSVYLDTYQIGKYEVTNAQFAAFCAAKPYTAHGDWQNADGNLTGYATNYPNHPVVSVTWNDAKAFCDYYGWHLPTEAEWEKAARGTDARTYPWGNTWDQNLCNNWNGPQLSGMADLSRGRGTLPVGSFPSGASPYGCMDMGGNVLEWCADWYSDTYYASSPLSNPQGSSSGSTRVVRNGSWGAGPNEIRCAIHRSNSPGAEANDLGFRVARGVQSPIPTPTPTSISTPTPTPTPTSTLTPTPTPTSTPTPTPTPSPTPSPSPFISPTPSPSVTPTPTPTVTPTPTPTVTPTPSPTPAAFSIISPVQGYSWASSTPTFSWNTSDGATSYTLEVATTPAFGITDVVNQTGLTETSYTVQSPLTAGIIYYWRVTAVNESGSTTASNAPFWFSSPVSIGTNPHGVAITPDGTRVLVVNDNSSGTVTVFSLTDHVITTTIPVGQWPSGIAITPGGGRALVTNTNDVSVINLSTSTVTNTISAYIATTLYGIAVTPNGTNAVMPDLSGAQQGMDIINLSTLAITNFIHLNTYGVPYGIAVTPDSSTALVTTYVTTSTIKKVNLSSLSVSEIMDVGPSYGVAITPDGSTAIVTSGSSDPVKRISLSTDTVTATIDYHSNTDFLNVAITPDGSKAIIVGDFNVAVISLDTNTVVATYEGGGSSVAVTPDGATAVITDTYNGKLRFIRISSPTH